MWSVASHGGSAGVASPKPKAQPAVERLPRINYLRSHRRRRFARCPEAVVASAGRDEVVSCSGADGQGDGSCCTLLESSGLERLWNLPLTTVPAPASAEPSWSVPLAFHVQLGEPPNRTTGDEKEKSDDYYANVGDAIRILRNEIPLLFARDLSYDIYRDDIVFRDPRNCFVGKKNYKTIFWSLRFHGRIFFSDLYVDVKRLWQTNDNEIRMRWTVRGKSRIPWEAQGRFDGVSLYKLDRHGRICEHQVDNVILSDPPKLWSPIFAGLNLAPSPRQPCPGAWFEPLSPSGTAAGPSSSAAAACAEKEVEGWAQLQQNLPRVGPLTTACWQGCEGMSPGAEAAAGAEGGMRSGGSEAVQEMEGYLSCFSWVRVYAGVLATTSRLQMVNSLLCSGSS